MIDELSLLKNGKTSWFPSWDESGRNGDVWRIEPGKTKVLADIKGLLIDLNDIYDKSQISFTVRDSHRSYRRAMLEAGFDIHLAGQTSPDDGRVFHIGRIAEVYSRHRDEDNLSFEVQVWDREVLRPWLRRAVPEAEE